MISNEKLTEYLLTKRKRNDKSKWLALAGYTLENWYILDDDLRKQVLPRDAEYIESTGYGKMFEIKAKLKGPNGRTLPVCTIWLVEKETDITKFITMYPDRRRTENEI